MKRILITVVAAALALTSAFALAGCGSSQSSTDKKDASSATESKAESAASQTAASISADDVVFTANGNKVELNSEMETVLAALGEAQNVSSQLSCHGEGEDKTYTYDGFIVNTYPLDGKDRVMEVLVNKEGIPTNKNIQVGSSVDDVVAAYGSGYKKVGVYYSYDAGNKMSLQFLIENDKVVEIDYYYTV